MRNELSKLIGSIPAESGFKQRMRFHQGWWRTFVLAEEQGMRPGDKEDVVCNTILNGQVTHKNLLSTKILNAVLETIQERRAAKSGIIEENRLFNNLLSSQPLCFNFFGELKLDTSFALKCLRQFWPEFTEVNNVFFEFAPNENYTNDNSAFDVAFEVTAGSQSGLVGLECKYTDTFSQKEYNRPEYKHIFNQEKSQVFNADYLQFSAARYNQLFRNQLIAEALKQNGHYQFVHTGLFCHREDHSAIQTGTDFQKMLNNGDKLFKVITYQDFIEKTQQLELSWEQRELSMLLWARYCAMKLSDRIFE